LFFVIACNKKEIQYELIGKVVDKNTDIVINNVHISIAQKLVTSTALNPNYALVESDDTDINGNYSLIFKREKVLDFKVTLSHDDYYLTEKIIQPSELSTENAVRFDFELTAKAWIKIRLTNSTPESGEIMNFYKHNVKENCEDCCSIGYTNIDGFNTPDTSFTCPVNGNDYFKYSYSLPNQSTVITDSIYCSGSDTTTLNITY
jgi:hypothetical protein